MTANLWKSPRVAPLFRLLVNVCGEWYSGTVEQWYRGQHMVSYNIVRSREMWVVVVQPHFLR